MTIEVIEDFSAIADKKSWLPDDGNNVLIYEMHIQTSKHLQCGEIFLTKMGEVEGNKKFR